jgi:N-acyl-D-amino-acid deacylase
MDTYDLVIRNGKLVDPAKNKVTSGTIAVKDGRIAAITGDDIQGGEEIDAQGLLVSPGFIDIHGHIDGYRDFAKLALLQGVTTTVGGNRGLSPVNLRQSERIL